MVLVKFLGTLCLDGQPTDPGKNYSNEKISIGDTVPEKAIPFLPWGKGLVATLPICANISWNELNEAGFATGKIIKIDGHYFLCRLIQVGQEEGAPNEWDNILAVYGRLETAYWHPNLRFWGQESSSDGSGCHHIRGGMAQQVSKVTDNEKSFLIGFRPFLEPFEPLSVNSRHIGKEVRLFGKGGSITGILKSSDEYDFVVESTERMKQRSFERGIESLRWAKLIGDKTVVAKKSSIVWTDLLT